MKTESIRGAGESKDKFLRRFEVQPEKDRRSK